jgi:hypothetical protein
MAHDAFALEHEFLLDKPTFPYGEKGFSHELAAQRVAQQYGYRALDNRSITKSEFASAAFEGAADQAWP